MKKTTRLLLAVTLVFACMAVSHASFAADTASMLGTGKAVADQTGLTQKATQEVTEKATQKAAQKTSQLINLNTASASQLTQLPGVGNKTADAIIEKRNKIGKFNSVDQLLDVKGIGTKKLEKIKPLVTL